jgi:hypothetical protein
MIKAGINYKFESGVPPATTTFRTPKEKTPPSDEDTENLAKASQNPVATLITVPFQNNANFRTGPFNRTQDVLNIQPVVPLKLGNDWNVIARTIAPLMSQPDPVFDHSTDGIGDITELDFGQFRQCPEARILKGKRIRREFCHCLGLAVTVKKLTRPLFCALNDR